MEELEIHLITRRQIPKRLIETLNLQACKDFTLKILTRYPQNWRVEDLNVDFKAQLLPVKLFYSSGTKYAMYLARNEVLCSAQSKYVLNIDDFTVIHPKAVEEFLKHIDDNIIIHGSRITAHTPWTDGMNKLLSWNWKSSNLGIVSEPIQKMCMTGGFHISSLHALKKINGWDVAFDGMWGLGDYSFGRRMVRAGFKIAQINSAIACHCKHIPHSEEKGDPSVSNRLFVYNKENGARMTVEETHCKRWGGNAQYLKYQDENSIIRAPVGLEEVCKLLK